MNTILLTGASGQVGWELARALSPLGTVTAPGRELCNLAQPQSLARLVDEVRPQIIVNAAAYTAVDQAESEQVLAATVNADAPAVLAAAARKHAALLLHYSTDYIFDGSKVSAYVETDTPNPLNAYGRSKLAGEQAIRASGADHLIFRTSWVYASRGKNFLKTILRLAAEREVLRIVDDQIGAPTWSRLVAETTALVLQHNLAMRSVGAFESSLLNLTASGVTSWHGFATAILAAAHERGMSFKCRQLTPITSAQYPLPATRPENSRMSCAQLEGRYALKMPAWDSSLQLVMDEIGGMARPPVAASLVAAHEASQ